MTSPLSAPVDPLRFAGGIVINGVGKWFSHSTGELRVLDGLSFSISTNEIVPVVGPSGCGKTTLLRILAGLTQPSEGSVKVEGRLVRGPGAERAVVFQEDSVFPWLTVVQNLEYGLRARGLARSARSAIVEPLLRQVGLDYYRDFYPKHLSGGMKKRVDLARAYANDPEILLMDEPFGALDLFTKERMQVDLLRLWKERPRPIFFVTHDIEEAVFLGSRVLIMTQRPGRFAAEIVVSLDERADPRIKTSRAFQIYRQRILEILRDVSG